jgi:hypothetical protein
MFSTTISSSLAPAVLVTFRVNGSSVSLANGALRRDHITRTSGHWIIEPNTLKSGRYEGNSYENEKLISSERPEKLESRHNKMVAVSRMRILSNLSQLDKTINSRARNLERDCVPVAKTR